MAEGGRFPPLGIQPKNEGDSRVVFERPAQQSTTLLKKRNTFGLIFTIHSSRNEFLSSSLIRSFEFLNFSIQIEF